MPAWIWMAALGLLAVATAVVLVRRRLDRLDREGALFWARKNARETVDKVREGLGKRRQLTADPRLGPGLEQRVAAYAARLATLEPRYEALPPGLADEFKALQQHCDTWYGALCAVDRVHEAAVYPHQYLAALEARAGPAASPAGEGTGRRSSKPTSADAASVAQRVAALRERIDQLDQRHQALKTRLLTDEPPVPLGPQAEELCAAYSQASNELYPLWKRLCPAEAQAAEAEAGTFLGQYLDFQTRFREAQQRDHRELAELEQREKARRSDADPFNTLGP